MKMRAEEIAEKVNAGIEEIKSKLNDYTSKEELKSVETKMAEMETKLTEAQKKEFDALKETINLLKDSLNGDGNAKKSLEQVVEEFVVKNHNAIKDAFKTGKGIVELGEIEKAVGIVTTANGTGATAPINFGAELNGVPNIRLRRPTILDHVNTYNTNQATLPYVEAVAGEGDFEVVPEGGVKPQLDIDWVTNYAKPLKFAGYIKVTEEVIEDIPRLRDMIVNYLRQKHDLRKEKETFKAIDEAATAYVSGGSLAGSVTMPNVMDVIGALNSQVINSPNYTDEEDFMGDTVLMNYADFFKHFGFAKDALGRPLYDNGYQAGNTFKLNGFTFVASSLVPAETIYLYDSKKIDVTTYKQYRVEIGWINDDFIRNQFCILGESRGHIVIKEHDKRAFVKANIANVLTDITATP